MYPQSLDPFATQLSSQTGLLKSVRSHNQIRMFSKRTAPAEKRDASAKFSKKSDSDSIRTSDQKTRQNTANFEPMSSQKLNFSVLNQFAPDAEEVRSLYAEKTSLDVVKIFLENQENTYVFNKKEHIV